LPNFRIAWDHINVFPTYENYVNQFEIFIERLLMVAFLYTTNMICEVKRVEAATNPIRKPYSTPNYKVENGYFARNSEGFLLSFWSTTLIIWLEPNGFVKMGVDEAEFYEAIASFKGASKDSRKLQKVKLQLLIKILHTL
jgi:UDP-N-acetylmuramate: L-alanyl-gamma-D-glutamyl-meso-diaminopimelate ligase